ncbi:MAG: hypothetical protein PHU21_03615 [Elusimicrobia bacterium]|nr:hypothetical protein [Elusimicrobiota bacterium]
MRPFWEKAFKAAALVFCLLVPARLRAGPPYVTDDPEPVAYKHWEIYLASQLFHDDAGWSGTLPHAEVNYGAAPDLQLHIIAPLSWRRPAGGPFHYGNGAIELGAKYRFVRETASRPMVGVFPLVEAPTGDRAQGLGGVDTPVFLPVWLQKTMGRWQSYGGGGWWFNPGAGNRGYLQAGWQAQYNIDERWSPGAELFYLSPQSDGGSARVSCNAGLVVNLTDRHHIMMTIGRDLHGPTLTQSYLAYQLTFGPRP